MRLAPSPEVVSALACPLCHMRLACDDASLVCTEGHRFDLSSRGYVNVLTGRGGAVQGDTREMLAERWLLLEHGLFDEVTQAVITCALGFVPNPRVIVDSGAGTGHHLAALVRRSSGAAGIALDVSRDAVIMASRHPRVFGVVCDIRGRLPLEDSSVDILMDVFAPRNAPEFARVLNESGVLIVVTPTQGHLRQIIEPLGMLTVDPEKDQRIATALGPLFDQVASTTVEHSLTVSREQARGLSLMGPAAMHSSGDDFEQRAGILPEELDVTLSVQIRAYRKARI